MIKFKLNKDAEAKDLDYFFGAGLSWMGDALGQFVYNSDGQNLTEQQVRKLAQRGYYPEPDLFSCDIERKELPKLDELKALSREELEKRHQDCNSHRDRGLDALRELKAVGGYLDSVTLKIIKEGYQMLDEKLREESFIYMDAMISKK